MAHDQHDRNYDDIDRHEDADDYEDYLEARAARQQHKREQRRLHQRRDRREDPYYGFPRGPAPGERPGSLGPRFPMGGRYGYDPYEMWGRDRYTGYHDQFGYEDPRDEMQPRKRGLMERFSDEVASWFGDEDAERRRERDMRGVGPRNYKRTDARITEDVSDRLMHDPVLDASDIEVTVSEGEVRLQGTVPSRREKRRAEDCADDVLGVTHVQNDLRVNRPAD